MTIALAVLLLPIASLDARVTDVAEIVRKVKSVYASTRSAEVRFEQTGGAGRALGKLTYATGDRYRLELPKQTLISDGTRVWTYTPDKRQVVVTRASKAPGRLTPEDLLTSFPGDYNTELGPDQKINGKSVWVVRCTPGSGKKIGDVTRATLYVDKTTFRFNQIDVESPSLGSVKLRILSAQYGLNVPSNRFTFTAPKDVRVIDLSK